MPSIKEVMDARGIKPIAEQKTNTTQQTSGKSLQSLMSEKGIQPVNPPRNDQLGTMMTEIGKPKEKNTTTSPFGLFSKMGSLIKGTVSGMGDIYKKVVEETPRNISEASKDIEKGGAGNILKGLLKGGLRTAGSAGEAIFAPLTAGIGSVMEQSGLDEIVSDTANKMVEASGITDQKWFQDFANKHPNAGDDLNKALLLAFSGMEKGTINPKRMAGEIRTGVSDFGGGVKTLATETKQEVSDILQKYKTNQLAKDASKVDNLTKQILQPGKKQPFSAETGAKVLQNLDGAQDVKTYKDLGDLLDAKIETYSNALDNTLSYDLTPRPFNTLKVNNFNYIEEAINQLDDFYTKTNNIPKQQAIRAFREKALSDGLTVQEINNLAKLHGQELNAFNSQGELASGLSKQSAENTRSGIKDTGRKVFNNKAYEVVDSEISELIKTKDLVRNMEKEVNYLKQKISQRGIGEKAGRLAFQIVDKITGGGLKGFIQAFIPRSAGLKLLNAMDLEKALNKAISEVKNLSKNVPNADATPQAIKSYFDQLESILKLPEGKAGTQSGQIDIAPIDRSGIMP